MVDNQQKIIYMLIKLKCKIKTEIWGEISQIFIVLDWNLYICSNGGGRSGAFLALDANLELLKRTGQIDVYEYGKILINARPHLIDSVNQYQFIYDALAEVSPYPNLHLKLMPWLFKSIFPFVVVKKLKSRDMDFDPSDVRPFGSSLNLIFGFSLFQCLL